MMEHDPAYGGSRLALALVVERKGDAVAAAREFSAAERCWADADSGLPELGLVRIKMATRTGAGS